MRSTNLQALPSTLSPIINEFGWTINQLIKGYMPGSVGMFRLSDSGNNPSTDPAVWIVLGPDGSVINAAGSTSQGLQEAIDYAYEHGYDLLVYGGGDTPGDVDASIISATQPIIFPPMNGGLIRFQSVTVNMGGSPAVGMQFDSMMGSDFEWRGGQLVCDSNVDIGVLFKPQSEVPIDPAGPVITTTRFLFPSIVMTKAGSICAKFDLSVANIGDGNVFEFIEPNGGAYGIQVVGNASNSFRGNTVRVFGAHANSVASVAVGINNTGAALIKGNFWDIECDPASTAIGVDIWGKHDLYRITVLPDEGPAAVGIKFETSAEKNKVLCAENEATTPVTDVSITTDNVLL